MSSNALLSELCSICYIEKPKYRCPRCKSQTCSLPCYKRHQQRASCNGKRNPAEYLKKNQIATPAGIDRDYNYLKGLEIDIDRAGRETADRGIGVRDTSKAVSRGAHPKSILQQYLNTNHITVNRAPNGMSRQKNNHTRSTKRHHVMWTVEWIDSRSTPDIQHNCLESSTMDEVYSLIQVEKETARKRRAEANSATTSSSGSKKRKQDEQCSQAQQHLAPGSPRGQMNDDATTKHEGPGNETAAPAESKAELTENEDRVLPRFYYLLRPGTTSSAKVLIPLAANATLTKSLQDQVVLEYPTIYVLPYSPEALPLGFMLEKRYTKFRKDEENELKQALKKADDKSFIKDDTKQETSTSSNPLDPTRILDMLKRDITR